MIPPENWIDYIVLLPENSAFSKVKKQEVRSNPPHKSIDYERKMNNMLKDKKLIKIIIISILAIIMVTVVLQNVAPIKLNFLFWTFTISRFLVVSLLLIIGFIFGWLLRGQFLLRKKEERFNAEGAEKNWRLWLKTKKKKARFTAETLPGLENAEDKKVRTRQTTRRAGRKTEGCG